MESDMEQSLPLCYSVYKLTKLSSFYAVQRLDTKSRVSIWASGYMQMILFCFPSPSRTGLQEMVKICENFAKATKLKFSTNIRIEKCKTKCLIFSKERINYNEISPILLN